MGWDKLVLRPGQTQHVRVKLAPERLAYWNIAANSWATASGQYKIFVGSSSRDIRVHDNVRIGRRR